MLLLLLLLLARQPLPQIYEASDNHRQLFAHPSTANRYFDAAMFGCSRVLFLNSWTDSTFSEGWSGKEECARFGTMLCMIRGMLSFVFLQHDIGEMFQASANRSCDIFLF